MGENSPNLVTLISSSEFANSDLDVTLTCPLDVPTLQLHIPRPAYVGT
jgi:hypothetical protein